uniref:Uncharacterized protein n=1 Tax=viral metagenome TaxID=1070528 RepID=A0A6C0I4L6_9ZZZZ
MSTEKRNKSKKSRGGNAKTMKGGSVRSNNEEETSFIKNHGWRGRIVSFRYLDKKRWVKISKDMDSSGAFKVTGYRYKNKDPKSGVGKVKKDNGSNGDITARYFLDCLHDPFAHGKYEMKAKKTKNKTETDDDVEW